MNEHVEFEGTYIRIVGLPRLETDPQRKTLRWAVQTKGGEHLGVIRWNSGWRCYSFYPDPDTLYEVKCMIQIAKFLETQTDLIRAAWRHR